MIKVKLDDVSLRRVCLIGLIEDRLHIELWIFTRNLLRSCFKWTAVWILVDYAVNLGGIDNMM